MKILNLYIQCNSQKDIAREVDLSEQAISYIVNSPVFQKEWLLRGGEVKRSAGKPLQLMLIEFSNSKIAGLEWQILRGKWDVQDKGCMRR